MTVQTAANVDVVIARETTVGTAAVTSAAAYRLRIVGSQGSELKRAIIRSMEKTDDAFQNMGRLGVKSVDGTYDVELTPGGANDVLLESIMRSAWVTTVAVGFATMTTVAIGTQTLTAAGGDFVGTQGLRVGDVFSLTTGVAANANGRHLITAIGSLTIVTTTGAFTVAAATSTGTLTVARKIIAATTPTRYSHSIEQYDEDLDLSELFIGMRLVGLDMEYRPGQMAKFKYTFMGMDGTQLDASTSPWFTSVTATTNTPLVADDASLRYNGAPVVNFTGFTLSLKIASQVVQTIGSTTPADVVDNDCSMEGTITATRNDFSNLTLFRAETEFSMSALLKAPSGAPPDFFSLYLPRIKVQSLSAPAGGDDGAKIETLGIMVGTKVAATGFDATPVAFLTSGP